MSAPAQPRDGSTGRFVNDPKHDLRALPCDECSKPWGVILPRGYDETILIKAARELEGEYQEWCMEVWGRDVSETTACPQLTSPAPKVTAVVFVSEATISWLADTVGHEPNVEAGMWHELDWCDLPEWWINRRRRFALRWDCCNKLVDPRGLPLALELEAAAR